MKKMEGAFGSMIRDVSPEANGYIPIVSDASDADGEADEREVNEYHDEGDKYELDEPIGNQIGQAIIQVPIQQQNFSIPQGSLQPFRQSTLPIIQPSMVWWRGPIPWNELLCTWNCPYCLHPGMMSIHPPPQVAPVYMHHHLQQPIQPPLNQAIPNPQPVYQMPHHQQQPFNHNEWNHSQQNYQEVNKNCLNPEAPPFNPRTFNDNEGKDGKEQRDHRDQREQRFMGDHEDNVPQVSVSHVFNNDDNRKGKYNYSRRNDRGGPIYRGNMHSGRRGIPQTLL